MADDIALVTANCGGIDPIFPLPAHPGIDAFYFTDGDAAGTRWSMISMPKTNAPAMEAKRIKCQIHRLEQVRGYRWLAWADSSFAFGSLDFLFDWRRRAETEGASAVFVPHPHRKTVAEEYAYILKLLDEGNAYLHARYRSEPLWRERAHFAERHDLSTLPMWCGGLWMVKNDPGVHAFLDHWWKTVMDFSTLDQAAISPLLVEHGLKAIPGGADIYQSEHWTRQPHA